LKIQKGLCAIALLFSLSSDSHKLSSYYTRTTVQSTVMKVWNHYLIIKSKVKLDMCFPLSHCKTNFLRWWLPVGVIEKLAYSRGGCSLKSDWFPKTTESRVKRQWCKWLRSRPVNAPLTIDKSINKDKNPAEFMK